MNHGYPPPEPPYGAPGQQDGSSKIAELVRDLLGAKGAYQIVTELMATLPEERKRDLAESVLASVLATPPSYNVRNAVENSYQKIIYELAAQYVEERRPELLVKVHEQVASSLAQTTEWARRALETEFRKAAIEALNRKDFR